jgi:hypothetical protein
MRPKTARYGACASQGDTPHHLLHNELFPIGFFGAARYLTRLLFHQLSNWGHIRTYNKWVLPSRAEIDKKRAWQDQSECNMPERGIMLPRGGRNGRKYLKKSNWGHIRTYNKWVLPSRAEIDKKRAWQDQSECNMPERGIMLPRGGRNGRKYLKTIGIGDIFLSFWG